MTTSLIDKIELLIKREKTTPDRKKDDPPKSSSEILSELFGAFNADPPKIDEIPVKKSKKIKKKHKKEKKKRSRSISSSSSDESEYSHKRKKRKKSSKAKKHRSRSRSRRQSKSPPSLSPPYKPGSKSVSVKPETSTKLEDIKVKNEEVKSELKQEPKRRLSNKTEEKSELDNHVRNIDASLIPMPESPKDKLDGDQLQKLDSKKSDTETDKAKGKIQIKNLKFSTVFEETVKKAEEEARKRAEKYEEGEYTDSSSDSVKEVVVNSQFPKTSDPGGLKKQAEDKLSEDEKSHKKSKKESSHKSSKRDRDQSKSKRSPSKSHRSRSPRKHRRSSSRARRSGSRTRRRSRSRSRRRDRDRDRYPRHHETRHRGERRRSRSPTGVKLADSEKKRLLEVARRNAINMLKNGAVPAGAAALPPHTRNQVMAAIQSGGKSVDELTDFCKHLSKKEALGELSSVSSHDEDMSENEDTLAFHHPFLVKEKAPIIMNIRGGAPLPIKSSAVAVANKEELRLQFPVSSGTQHREKSSEWRPVSPKKDDMQVAIIGSSNSKPSPSAPKAIESGITSTSTKPALPAPPVPLGPPAPPVSLGPPAPPVPLGPPAPPLPLGTPAPPIPLAPPGLPALPAPPAHPSPNFLKALQTAAQLSLSTSGGLAALPAPGPQAYPPGVEPPNIDLAKIVSQKLQMIRKEQEHNELTATRGVSYFGWSKESPSLGEFHGGGASGAQFLTPRELASGTQAWAKKVPVLQRAS